MTDDGRQRRITDRHGSGLGPYHEVAATYTCGCGAEHESHTAPIQGELWTFWSPECAPSDLRAKWKAATFHLHYYGEVRPATPGTKGANEMGKHSATSKEEFELLPPCSFDGCTARYDNSMQTLTSSGWAWPPDVLDSGVKVAPHDHAVDFESAYPERPFTITVTDETGAIRFSTIERAHSATGAMQQVIEKNTNRGW